jgi:HlyD family secretion protein
MKKALIAVAVILVLGAVVGLTIWRERSGYTKVLTAKVVRQNLVSTVSATGQIKPKEYVNLGATAFGRITHLYVKEGAKVHKGEVVATIESVQQNANVTGQKAAILAAEKDIAADLAAERTSKANIEHAKAQLDQARSQFARAKALYKAQVMSRQNYDTDKATYLTNLASLQQAHDQYRQNQAQTAAARAHLLTQQATLKANEDLLSKTVAIAPFDGIVTNLPVRVGETVVEGIQNSQGSTLMTIANMSAITAEVMVDEDDIVNVAIGQPVKVNVDALPDQTFKGVVTEVGDQALLRSTGVSTSQSTATTNEAKDFKVVVTLQDPSHKLKPGLSCTAKITTATANNAIAIPIQALTMRTPASLKKESPAVAAVAATKEKPNQGVFVVSPSGKPRVHFVQVKTGITGTTNIQVLSGLKPGQEIVIGPYNILRTLKNSALIKREKTGLTPAKSSS